MTSFKTSVLWLSKAFLITSTLSLPVAVADEIEKILNTCEKIIPFKYIEKNEKKGKKVSEFKRKRKSVSQLKWEQDFDNWKMVDSMLPENPTNEQIINIQKIVDNKAKGKKTKQNK